MNDREQKRKAKEFADRWTGRGNEKSDNQSFWIDLLQNVYDIKQPTEYISFEKRVKNSHTNTTNFIDGYISSTLVMIEQKDIAKDLLKPIKQSSGLYLNAYQQAKQYSDDLKLSEKPRWIITCNFKEFYIYDMDKAEPEKDPLHIKLSELPKQAYQMDFLVSQTNHHLIKEQELSIKAGELVGKLYDSLLEQYKLAPLDEKIMHEHLNKLCVRLVFCLYAEDSGLFEKKNQFHDYLSQYSAENIREALKNLFKVLNTKNEERDPYLSEQLKAFPYVNGGLFADESVLTPPFTDELRTMLLDQASDEFDWSDISPTIFGAVFESTLNPETRRKGGMHYTSIENIHKVIDPLFLDDLKDEFNEIMHFKREKIRNEHLQRFQDKLASLRFLDPAAGSGNFLTETYLCLRKLENKIISIINKNQFDLYATEEGFNPIKVSIDQFYGIEINDFAVTVAKTAMWIAESQMMDETSLIMMTDYDFLPLKTNANIVEGNALRMDWNDVIPASELNYIMGNPPFVGTKMMDKSQKEDVKKALVGYKNYGTLDYVACWYAKSCDFIDGTNIKCAFVSTNSIVQGEQVTPLWKELFKRGIIINYAFRTFVWDNEANLKAQVHCVIIGFSKNDDRKKYLFDGKDKKEVKHINAYLVEANDVFIESQRTPICDVQKMYLGCDFKDDNNYIFSEDEKNRLIKKDKNIEKYLKKYVNAKELTNNTYRYCLWLNDVDPSEIKDSSTIMEIVEAVRYFRMNSKSSDTQRYADLPMRPARLRYYSEKRNTSALCLPRTSSASRKYLPMELLDSNTIGGASILMIPNATLYTFGILNSNVHMNWMKTVCGRMKSDYRYANGLVYNTFPWPTPSEEQKAKIEHTAQAILDARSLYPDSSLADMYDPDNEWMFPELIKAHKKNDKAVMDAYGFSYDMSESEIVAELMKMYQKLIAK